MPFTIIRNDIARVKADAIVNTANPHPQIGAGTDKAIYEAAGAERLLAERKKIGDIPVGKAAVTSAFALDAKYIIHTVGPFWAGGNHGEQAALRSCYHESLKLAQNLGCESIAFPLISTGVYGFPKDLAIKTATSVIYDFLMENDMMVYLVVFDRKAYDLSGKLFQDVHTYIDEHYVSVREDDEYRDSDYRPDSRHEKPQAVRDRENRGKRKDTEEPSGSHTIGDHLKQPDISFREYLLQLINQRDLKNSEVYHGANITRQHFSKIMSNSDYHPSKNTACALAISLHLDLPTTNALLEKAGMVLSGSSRFDLAVQYFILHGMYNIIDDNIILYENDLELRGTR